MHRILPLALLALSIALLSACSEDDDTGAQDSATSGNEIDDRRCDSWEECTPGYGCGLVYVSASGDVADSDFIFRCGPMCSTGERGGDPVGCPDGYECVPNARYDPNAFSNPQHPNYRHDAVCMLVEGREEDRSL